MWENETDSVAHLAPSHVSHCFAPILQKLMEFFVARELGTANMLSRWFDWSSCLLWPQDEIFGINDPQRCQVYLAEKDVIVDAAETRRYLRQYGLRETSDFTGRDAPPPDEKHVDKRANLHLVRGAAHGEVLMTGGHHMEHIVDWLDDADGGKQ